MAQRAFPFDGVVVTEEDYLALQSAQRGGGIVGDPLVYSDPAVDHLSGVIRYSNHLVSSDALRVTPGAGRSVDIAIGRAAAPGFLFENDDLANVAVTPNTTGGVRNDTVVARFDFADNVGELAVVAAAGPTRGYPVWEVPLARLAVPNGFATLAAADVFDLRRFVGDRVPLRGFGAGSGQGRYYPVGYVGHSDEIIIGAQTAYFMPFVTGQQVGLSKVSVVTGASGPPSGSLRLAVYRAALGRGMPDVLIADLGTLPLTVADTVYEVGVTDVRFVNPEVYYLALASLTGVTIGPVRCGVVSMTTGTALAEPAVHMGGVSLASANSSQLRFAAYQVSGLAGAWPDPVNAAALSPTPISPIGFLSGG